jgi:hypothetical protein
MFALLSRQGEVVVGFFPFCLSQVLDTARWLYYCFLFFVSWCVTGPADFVGASAQYLTLFDIVG